MYKSFLEQAKEACHGIGFEDEEETQEDNTSAPQESEADDAYQDPNHYERGWGDPFEDDGYLPLGDHEQILDKEGLGWRSIFGRHDKD